LWGFFGAFSPTTAWISSTAAEDAEEEFERGSREEEEETTLTSAPNGEAEAM
jgi:hypothetical protein